MQSLLPATSRQASKLFFYTAMTTVAVAIAGLVLWDFIDGEKATGTAFLYLSAVMFLLLFPAGFRWLALRNRENNQH